MKLQPINLPAVIKQIEDAFIDAALTQLSGNKKAAAKLLGINRTTLISKLKNRNRGK